jgi:hypothetical protein
MRTQSNAKHLGNRPDFCVCVLSCAVCRKVAEFQRATAVLVDDERADISIKEVAHLYGIISYLYGINSTVKWCAVSTMAGLDDRKLQEAAADAVVVSPVAAAAGSASPRKSISIAAAYKVKLETASRKAPEEVLVPRKHRASVRATQSESPKKTAADEEQQGFSNMADDGTAAFTQYGEASLSYAGGTAARALSRIGLRSRPSNVKGVRRCSLAASPFAAAIIAAINAGNLTDMEMFAVIPQLCSRGEDGLLEQLGAAGVCERVVQCMQAHSKDSSTQSSGCICIIQLATLPANSTRLGTAGACAAVIKALKLHSEDELTVTQSFGAICYLTDDVINRKLLKEAGACQWLVNTLVSFKTASVQAWGSRAVWELCCDYQIADQLGDIGAIQAVTAALEFDDAATTVHDMPEDCTLENSSNSGDTTSPGTSSNSSSSLRDKSEWSLGALASLIRVKSNAVKALRLGTATAIVDTLTAYMHKVSSRLLLPTEYHASVVVRPF